MNVIFFAIVLIAFLVAGWKQLTWLPLADQPSPIEALSKAMIDSATGSVELALGLVGAMTLFLGLMKVAEAGGMLLKRWRVPESIHEPVTYHHNPRDAQDYANRACPQPRSDIGIGLAGNHQNEQDN